jgi:hypothetical protein
MSWVNKCFDINKFGTGPLHKCCSLSYSGFEFSKIFIIENLLPDINVAGIR